VTLTLGTPDPALLAELSSANVFSPDLGHFAVLEAIEMGAHVQPIPEDGLPADSILLLPPPATSMDRLVKVVDRLLGPGGCPWDQKQTHDSLKKYLLEEAYEVIEAIETKDVDALREELGDLLLQPVMHGQISRAAGGFDTFDSASAIVDKLIRRHPHVFGDLDVRDADEVLRNWDQIKKREKGDETRSVLAGVPRSMPSLHRAYEVSKRAVRSGFEWPDVNGVFEKMAEEERELREAIESGDREHIESEVGDLLFTIVNLARWSKVDPEEALRKMVDRFTRRFQHMELSTKKPLTELSFEEWDALWNAAKVAERSA
jgi:tetrapyrrole methylase family protein/MazG family protein